MTSNKTIWLLRHNGRENKNLLEAPYHIVNIYINNKNTIEQDFDAQTNVKFWRKPTLPFETNHAAVGRYDQKELDGTIY